MSRPLPDIVAPNLQAIFCGINPGLSAAAQGHHFIGRNNRFWRVLHLAGFTSELMLPQNDRSLLNYGYGLTAAVQRATARAAELSTAELAAASSDLERKVVHYRPRYIAFLGKAAYAAILGRRDIPWGAQPSTFGNAAVWVLPNPSGLNRSFSLEDLTRAFRGFREVLESKAGPSRSV